MIRSLRPTDVIAYLQFRKTESIDCAATSGGYPSSSPGIGSFFNGSVGLYGGAPTWALIEQHQIVGLISITAGPGNFRWEINHLIVKSGRDFRRVVHELLEHLSMVAAEDRVPIVHLRVDVASPAVQMVLDSSFVRYAEEDVYVFGPVNSSGPNTFHGIRPRKPADDLGLFQLYSALRPIAVRQYEGVTLWEWRKIDGWIGPPIGLRRLEVSSRRDFVVQVDDSIVGWVQIDRHHNIVRGELDTPARQELDGIIDFGRGQTDVNSGSRWIVRDHQGWLGAELAHRSALPMSTHLLLARPLAIRVAEPELVPLRA